MTDSLKTLFSASWQYAVANMRPILMASIVFGALIFGGQMLLKDKFEDAIQQNVGDIEQLEELANRIEEGDEEAFQEMMQILGANDEGQLNEEVIASMAGNFMLDALPSIGLFSLLTALVSAIAGTLYLLIATGIAVEHTHRYILPMLGVWIWGFLRSFAWIPFIGIIFAIVLGPRFMVGSVILLSEKKGVRESVALSYERSRGYWGKLVGNSIVLAIAMMIALMLLNIVLSMMAAVSSSLAIFLASVAQYLAAAFASIFYVKLCETVMKHPLKVVSAK